MKTFTRVLVLTLAVLMLTLAMVSCGGPAKKPEDAKKALEDNKYTIIMYIDDADDAKALFGEDKGVVAYISAVDEDLENSIIICYFESSAKAKEYYADMDKEDVEDGMVLKCSGKMIYMGTEAAIKAAK